MNTGGKCSYCRNVNRGGLSCCVMRHTNQTVSKECSSGFNVSVQHGNQALLSWGPRYVAGTVAWRIAQITVAWG